MTKDHLPAFSCQALSLLWRHYVEKLVIPDLPDHVLIVYHTQLVKLPWEKFFPDMQAIELMMKVKLILKLLIQLLIKLLIQICNILSNTIVLLLHDSEQTSYSILSLFPNIY